MSLKANTVLSKSKYVAGLQCSKRLWTEVHARELVPSVDAATQARFDQGHTVGSLALGLYPGGLEIGPGVRRWDRVVADTERALTQRRPLYEAAFRWASAACRVDILVPVSGNQWDVLEVKSSTGVKDVHYTDLALQAYVLEGCGIEVRDYYLVHLDSSYVRSGELDLQGLLCRERVTEEIRDRQSLVADNLAQMREVLRSTTRPEVAIGRHCNEPYECALKPECWSFLPPLSVFDLTRGKRRAFNLLAQGVLELGDIPDSADLGPEQAIQLRTVRSGEAHVDTECLSRFLEQLEYPLFYFDIETFGPAIPRFDQSRPYEQIPFLFSIHRVEAPGQTARHYAYMYEGDGDPRPDFLRATRASLGSFGSIVAYNAPFESRILRASAKAVLPDLQPWAEELASRFVDLLTPFREFAYHHPLQAGSASLKAVLTPLTGMSYADLDIGDGEMASRQYQYLYSDEVDPRDRVRILRQLEEYCSLDTLGMVAIVERLEELTSHG